ALKDSGVDLMLLGFQHCQEEVGYFWREVITQVRELEQQRREVKYG
ncbi:dimethyl sulfone monooxygenase SfnG, partial [Erwinia amylovora]|nr:dimethyl sulfone monooxygenase SfnG [Erwinia amylovora]